MIDRFVKSTDKWPKLPMLHPHNKLDFGLNNNEFQKNIRHKNLIFSHGIDLIHEFFNIDRKLKSNFLSKSVKLINKYPVINKIFTKIADKGSLL